MRAQDLVEAIKKLAKDHHTNKRYRGDYQPHTHRYKKVIRLAQEESSKDDENDDKAKKPNEVIINPVINSISNAR